MSLEQQPDSLAGPYALSPASSFALDLIRTLAAQTVVVGHSILILGLLPFLRPPHFAYIQNVAVVVFFLLSGLLISYSVLTRPERSSFTVYFIDRFARIYSGLVPALLFIAVVDGLLIYLGADYVQWEGYSWLDLVGNVVMLQDYPILGPQLGITSFGTARVLWTLAIEWWLYLLFGWLVLSRMRGVRFWIGVVVLLPVPLYNVIGGRGDGLTAMWVIGLMCCLALRTNLLRVTNATGGWLLVLVLASLAGARLWLTKDAYDLLFAVMTASAMVTLIAILDTTQPQVPRWLQRSVGFAADYSFTLYLVHLSIIAFVLFATEGLSSWPTFLLIMVVANVVAALLALKTEMQHRRLRRFIKLKYAVLAGREAQGKPIG